MTRALSPEGRMRRRAFWAGALGASAAFTVLFVAVAAVAGRPTTLVLYPPFFWAAYVLMARRLHDRGRSPLWLLLLAVPVLGPLWTAIDLFLLRGTRGENRYGPDPRNPVTT